MLHGGVQPSLWVCAPLLAQRLAVHAIYSVHSKCLGLANLFSFQNGPVKSETMAWILSLWQWEHNCEDFLG